MTQPKYPPLTPWQVGSSLMWSLGEFNPRLTDENEVGQKFTSWLRVRGISVGEPHVRCPDHGWSLKHTRFPQGFHQDGITWGNSHLVVWSNTFATEIRDTDGKVYQGAPCEVIAFDNRHFYHMSPFGLTNAQKDKRWFIRAEIGPKVRLQDKPGIYACTLARRRGLLV